MSAAFQFSIFALLAVPCSRAVRDERGVAMRAVPSEKVCLGILDSSAGKSGGVKINASSLTSRTKTARAALKNVLTEKVGLFWGDLAGKRRFSAEKTPLFFETFHFFVVCNHASD